MDYKHTPEKHEVVWDYTTTPELNRTRVVNHERSGGRTVMTSFNNDVQEHITILIASIFDVNYNPNTKIATAVFQKREHIGMFMAACRLVKKSYINGRNSHTTD